MNVAGEAPSADKILVALRPPDAVIRVAGRGTFKSAGALKQFGQAARDGGCRRLLFDMAACTGMDSTFMGVLAGLATRLRQAGGEVALLELNPRTRGLVATLGLDHVVAAFEPGQAPESYLAGAGRAVLRSLPAGKEGRQETANTMLEAHEQLVDLEPENAPRFKDVLTFLREDIKSGGGSGK